MSVLAISRRSSGVQIEANVKAAFEPIVAHQASSMKRLGVFLLPHGWDASPLQGYPQH